MSTSHPVQREQLFLVAGVLIASIGVSTLVGWVVRNAYLTNFVPSVGPMNPMTAVGFLLLSGGIFSLWLQRQSAARIFAVLVILLGVLAIVTPEISYVLFSRAVHSYGTHVKISFSAAMCFMASGISLGLLSFRNEHWGLKQKMIPGFVLVLLTLLALFNLYGQLYAHAGIRTISPTFVMAFNSATAFVIGSLALLGSLFGGARDGKSFRSISPFGWMTVLLILGLQAATYITWKDFIAHNVQYSQQAFQDKTSASAAATANRITSYADALRGFRGFYASSEKVTQGEFHTYYNELNLGTAYPGFRLISYVTRVEDSQVSAFIADRIHDTSLNSQGNPNFAIPNLTKSNVHYLVTYIEGLNTPVTGNDLSTIPQRVALFQNAQKVNTLTASSTSTLIAYGSLPKQQGFIITVPVSTENKSGQVIGFVNATFGYEPFFNVLFKEQGLSSDIGVEINNGSDTNGQAVYTVNSAAHTSTMLSRTVIIPVVDTHFSLTYHAPSNFALSSGQRQIPGLVILSGQLISLLLLVILYLQSKSRANAYKLAEKLTLDVQKQGRLLEEANKKDEAVLSSIGEGLISVDKDGVVERINHAALRMLGYAEDELVGKKFTEVVTALDPMNSELTQLERPLSKVLLPKGEALSMARMVYRRKDGEPLPVSINVSPIMREDVKVGAIEVFQDNSEAMKLEQQKDEFVSLTSHQLRTPLTSIRLFTEMLLDSQVGELNPGQRDYLQKVFDSTLRMTQLVGDFLNISRIDLGRLKVQPVPTQISDLVKQYVDDIAPVAKEKDITLVFTPVDLPEVPIDRSLYGQIIHNLLSNAVRYTPNGGTVTVNLHKKKEGYVLEISDTGIGIPKNEYGKIFQRFFRTQNAVQFEGEGSGLGLYLVKKILDLTDGSITFDSVEGKGTTFKAIIPLAGMRCLDGETGLSETK